MTSHYENLAEFLGTYFHQDWTSDTDSSLELARIYLSEWPREEALLAMQELVLLLRTQDDDEVARTIAGMGCYFVPASEGYTSASDWLRTIEALMCQVLVA